MARTSSGVGSWKGGGSKPKTFVGGYFETQWKSVGAWYGPACVLDLKLGLMFVFLAVLYASGGETYQQINAYT